MSNFIFWLNNNPLTNTIISGIIGGGITYFYTVSKMKKERKIEYEKSVGSKISDSLFAVREVIKEADVQEIYDADNNLEIEARTTELGKFAIYPAILNDKDSLLEFWEKINNVRIEHELYLSYTSSAYLLYMLHYLTKLIQFLGIFNKISYPLVGTILTFDIQSWQRSFDKHLVKEINNNQLKLTSKTGKKWENAKEKITNKFWNSSLLKQIINDIDTSTKDINVEILNYIDDYIRNK